MEKQTAVEWLIDKLSSQPIDDINDEYWFGIIGQAKQMEKEESESKLVNELVGFQFFLNDLGFINDCDWNWEDAAKQYNETYNNEK